MTTEIQAASAMIGKGGEIVKRLRSEVVISGNILVKIHDFVPWPSLKMNSKYLKLTHVIMYNHDHAPPITVQLPH